MDKLRRDVIALLQEDSRFSAEQIAVMLNKSDKEIRDIIAELENDGVIVKYTTIINAEKTGDEFVDALIEVKVTPQQRNGFDSIAEEIYKFDMVKNVYLMSGTYDLAITIEGKTVRDIALFVSEKLAAIASVTSTTTHFILKQYKNGGVILDTSEVEKRQLFNI